MDPITGTVTSTLPISAYMSLFSTALSVTTPTGYVPVTSTLNFSGIITNSAPIIPFVVAAVGDSVFRYYLGLRIGMTAILFVVAFVLRRIGVPVQRVVITDRRR